MNKEKNPVNKKKKGKTPVSTNKMKKITSKRKQKGRGKNSKIKREAEKLPEDEFSELEKETLIIRINELNSKVNRKKDLCNSLKEENKLYKYFYDKEIKGKKNSTKLLNSAYEELATEIVLLKAELVAMENNYNILLEDKEFCVEAKKKVNRLSNLKTILDAKLSEAEKCPAQNIDLRSKLDELQMENVLNSNRYKEEKDLLFAEFKELIKKVQDDMKDMIANLIEDRELKLHLLHVPYQGLFLCGIKETSYLDLALHQIDRFLLENIQLEKDLIQMDLDTMIIKASLRKLALKLSVNSEVMEYLQTQSYDKTAYSEIQEEKQKISVTEIENHLLKIEELKAKILFEERRIRRLEEKLIEQEKVIIKKEKVEKESVNNIHMATVIIMAGEIIRREVQVMQSL